MKNQIKKVIAILLCLVIAIPVSTFFVGAETAAVWDGTVAEGFEAGSGTAEDPYQITSGGHLALMAQYVNSLEDEWTLGGLYFKLMNDIDLANKPFAPIGGRDDTYVFQGYFDGNGKTISNINICAMDEYMGEKFEAYFKNAGLFGLTRNAVIRDLTLAGDFKATTNWNVGAIVGRAEDTEIINCHVLCDELDFIAEPASLTTLYWGGIVGYVYHNSPVYECSVQSDIKLTGRGNTASDRTNIVGGGLVGHFNHQGAGDETFQYTIENSYFKGKIYCESDIWIPYVGGAVGVSDNITGSYPNQATFIGHSFKNVVVDVVIDFSKAKFNAGTINSFGGFCANIMKVGGAFEDVHTKVEFIGCDLASHPEITGVTDHATNGGTAGALGGIDATGRSSSTFKNVTTSYQYMTGNWKKGDDGVYTREKDGWKGNWDTETCKTGVSDLTLYVANVNAAVTANANREDSYDASAFDIIDPFTNEVPEVDFTALEAAIAEAKAIDTTKYTSLTVQTLNTVIAAGEALVGSATRQNDVDDAVAAIEDAINGLKEETPEEPENPGTQTPTEPEPENPTTGDDNKTEEKKGCGSSITLAGVAMIAAFGAAAVAVAKKKED